MKTSTILPALVAIAALAPMSASAICKSSVTFENNTSKVLEVQRMYTSLNGSSGWRTKLGFKEFDLQPGEKITKKMTFGRKKKNDFTIRVTADNDINNYYWYEGSARNRCKDGHHIRFDSVLHSKGG